MEKRLTDVLASVQKVNTSVAKEFTLNVWVVYFLTAKLVSVIVLSAKFVAGVNARTNVRLERFTTMTVSVSVKRAEKNATSSATQNVKMVKLEGTNAFV
jgi:hypothetical protein